MTTQSLVALEQVQHRNVQKHKYAFAYGVEAIVPAGQSKPVILNIDHNADFLLEKLTGAAYGPCDNDGVPTYSATDFRQPGIGASAGFAGRGLSVQITDMGTSRNLTNGFIPVETILTPGYGIAMFMPFPLKYFFNRKSSVKFEFKNLDSQAQQKVNIVLHGQRFELPAAA